MVRTKDLLRMIWGHWTKWSFGSEQYFTKAEGKKRHATLHFKDDEGYVHMMTYEVYREE